MRCAAWKPILLAVTFAVLMALPATPTLAQGKKGGGTTPPPTSIRYSLELITPLGAGDLVVAGLNGHGDVVGRSDSRAYLSTVVDGTRITVDLNDLISAEDKLVWRNLNYAFAINDAGQIVGQGHHWNEPSPRGFRLTPAYVDETGSHAAVLEDLGLSIVPKGINGWGDVTGDYASPDGNRAFVLSDSGFQDLGVLYPEHNFSRGMAINAFGQVSGFSAINPGPHTAILFTPGIGMQDLGVIKPERNGTRLSLAYGLNDAGDVVGLASAGGMNTRHAFRWRAGVMQDLGTLGGTHSSAWSINNAGYIVGRAQVKDGSDRAFVFHDNFGMTNLEPLIVDLPAEFQGRLPTDSLKINDAGQISGTCSTDAGLRGYILTPLP